MTRPPRPRRTGGVSPADIGKLVRDGHGRTGILRDVDNWTTGYHAWLWPPSGGGTEWTADPNDVHVVDVVDARNGSAR